MLKYFNIFLSKEELNDQKYTYKLENDIIKCYFKYGATPDEYFGFGFRYCNSKRRSEFLTLQHKDKTMIRLVGMEQGWDMLEDKYLFYTRFKNYFKRDVCIIKENKDLNNFTTFVEKHKIFIIKPIDGQSGKGIEYKDTEGSKEVVIELFNQMLHNGSYIVEELIIQHKKMAEWNSSSVNTIRLPTFLKNGEFHVLKPFIRFGRKGSKVDNTGQGGLSSVIDEITGILITDGYSTRTGNYFKKHPDSGLVFLSWQVPCWKELLKIAEEIHRTIPTYPYVGWDFAFTDKGWILIEGNWGAFTSEHIDKEGIKEKFDSLF